VGQEVGPFARAARASWCPPSYSTVMLIQDRLLDDGA